jgi:hypothetical protein
VCTPIHRDRPHPWGRGSLGRVAGSMPVHGGHADRRVVRRRAGRVQILNQYRQAMAMSDTEKEVVPDGPTDTVGHFG